VRRRLPWQRLASARSSCYCTDPLLYNLLIYRLSRRRRRLAGVYTLASGGALSVVLLNDQLLSIHSSRAIYSTRRTEIETLLEPLLNLYLTEPPPFSGRVPAAQRSCAC